MTAQHITSAVADAPEAPVDSPVLRSLDALHAIEERIESMAVELRKHIPALQVQRAFYDGSWVIGLRVGGRLDRSVSADGKQSAERPFSRLDIQIALDTEHGRVELTSLSTVRNRDKLRETLSVTLDDAGHADIDAFLENAVLAFVDRYFDRS
jgi:hypothetical protein